MASSPEKRYGGCGLVSALFGRRTRSRRRANSTGSIPKVNSGDLVKKQSPTSNQRRSVSEEPTFSTKRSDPPQRATIVKSVNAKTISGQAMNHQGYVSQGRKLPKEAAGISGELEMMIADHQKSKGSSNMIRASSGNVMLYGNLGNLRQKNASPNTHSTASNGRVHANGGTGNVKVKRAAAEEKTGGSSLCRALSTRMDPETLKIMGNEDYKNGNYAEALALYEAAIAIDPEKASYRSNKSAALAALGRILEAVFECREAIRIDPYYHRAHHRLGNLYTRLGEVEKAIYHYKQAGPEADGEDVGKAKAVEHHVSKCCEAKRRGDWNSLIKATHNTITAGATSAPQIHALRAEAFLKLYKHEEADRELEKGPKFNVDDCTKFFGPIGNANLLVVRSQVDLAVGRFDEAVSAIEKAVRLDPNNREAGNAMVKAKAVTVARSRGNDMFKANRYKEASSAYGEGLDHDPFNSVLLCNRAACWSKLHHYEKAVEDCSAALNLRPGYRKARLRRADCYSKLHKWEASLRDYEILRKETPEDEEANKGLVLARSNLNNNDYDKNDAG